VKLPEGPRGLLPTDVKPAATNLMQTRFTFFHPSKAVNNCDNPKRWRWGKPPRTYRGLRKIWVAQDLATRDRDVIKPAAMVKTPIPALGLAGVPDVPSAGRDGGADGGAAASAQKKSNCDCTVVGRRTPWGAAELLAGVLGVAGLGRRRRRRRRR
jgi:MYXO-CTERM domain-containing protein